MNTTAETNRSPNFVIRPATIVDVPLREAIGRLKTVDPEFYELARSFFS